MARAGTRSSQRQPTQTQAGNAAPGPSQQRRPRNTQPQDEGGDDGSSDGEQDEMDVDQEENTEGAAEFERKACALVRLAIFSEQRRLPIRRDEITKKVLGGKSKEFTSVMIRAQSILQKVFGMELAELRAPIEPDDLTQKDKDAANGKKKATSTGTKSYILRSCLPAELIQSAVIPDGELLAAEMKNQEGVTLDDNDAHKFDTGSIISWNMSDELGSLGILYVILALILVSGRAISESELRKQLRKLHLDDNSSIHLTTQSTQPSLTLTPLLNSFLRQSYLEHINIASKSNTKGKKRSRNVASTQGGSQADVNHDDWEFRWGPRAKAEVGEVGVANFLAEFMATRIPLDADDGSKKAQLQRRVEAMMGGIQKAAGGGELVGNNN